MSEHLNKLKNCGIKIAERSENGRIFEFEDEKVRLNVSEDFKWCAVTNIYDGCKGLIKVKYENAEAVLLKGFYKDFIRPLENAEKLEEKELSSLAQIVTDIEKEMNCDFKALFVIDKWFDIYLAEIKTEFIDEPANEKIFKCYSAVEYSLEKQEFYRDGILYGRGAFSAIVPEVMSPLFTSVVARILNILNPLFMSAGIKTESPSIRLILNRLYMNYSNAEKIINTLGGGYDAFLLSNSPAMVKNRKKTKFPKLKTQILNIDTEEIEETLTEINEYAETISIESIFLDEFIEMNALTIMAYEITDILLWETMTDIYSSVDDLEIAIKVLYKNYSPKLGEKLEFIDTACGVEDVKEFIHDKEKDIKELLLSLPKAKRMLINKSKLEEKAETARKIFEIKEKVQNTLEKIVISLKKSFESLAKKLKEDEVLVDTKDIHYFTIGDLKDFSVGKTGGLKPFPVHFKKWKFERSKAQILPPEILEKDIENIPDIAKRLHTSQISKTEFEPLVINSDDIEGKVTLFSNENADYSGKIVAASHIPEYRLCELKNAKAIIVENSTYFSPLIHMCVKNGITLISGIRLATEILTGKTVKLSADKLKVSYE